MKGGNTNYRLLGEEVEVVGISRGAPRMSMSNNNNTARRRRGGGGHRCVRRRRGRRMRQSLSFLSSVSLLAMLSLATRTSAASSLLDQQHLNSNDRAQFPQPRDMQQNQHHYPLRSNTDVQPQSRSLRNEQEHTNNSDEGGGGSSTTVYSTRDKRVMIDTFDVVLDTTPFELNQRDINNLHGTMEQVIADYISRQPDLPLIVSVDYVLLGDIRTQSASFSQTNLNIAAGIVHFDVDEGSQQQAGNLVPSQALVNQWVKEAIDTQYAKALEGTDYYYIQSASSPREQDDGEEDRSATTPLDEERGPAFDNVLIEDEGPVNTSGSSNTHWVVESTGLLAAIVVATALVVAVSLFAIIRRRSYASNRVHYIEHIDSSSSSNNNRNNSNKMMMVMGGRGVEGRGEPPQPQQHHDNVHVFNTDSTDIAGGTITPPCGLSPIKVSSLMSCYDDGNKSLAGSESDFTVNTEAGDSAAIKSLCHVNHNDSTYKEAKKMIATESFQRERHVSLRKDMLTSAWSGRGNGNSGSGTTNNAGTLCATRIHNESVLAPSHFSASEERTRLTTTSNNNDVSNGNANTAADNDNNSSNSSKEGSLIFEQANEDNQGVITLMTPPSQAMSRYRRVGGDNKTGVGGGPAGQPKPQQSAQQQLQQQDAVPKAHSAEFA